jgi:hypothetical protein
MRNGRFQPLNPVLYAQLEARFGTVRVSAPGVAMVAHYGPDQKLIMAQPGEQYLVCCPRCGDTRFRLSINHRWSVRDVFGHQNLWLLHCFNEDCFSDPQNRYAFYEELVACGTYGRLEDAKIGRGTVVLRKQAVEPPGPMLPLHTLPPEHPANRYLAGRFIDPELVGKFYGVSYCPESKYYLAKNRIIIPIMEGGKLRGWQARHVGDLDWKAEGVPPKYWNCPGMSRGDIVYNLDNAAKYLTGVVVEGPTDVWSFGPMGMATIGFPPTQQQMGKIVAAFRNKSLVLLFDPDIMEKERPRAQFNALWQQIKGECQHGVARVQLPSSFDPGDLDREYLRPYVASEARRQGVHVAWRSVLDAARNN